MLLKLSGDSSVLRLSLEHPIHLDPKHQYCLALLGFYSENNICNLRSNDYVYFWDTKDNKITEEQYAKANLLESGFHTLDNIQNYFREFLRGLSTKVDVNLLKIEQAESHVCIYSPLDFYLGSQLSELLGFEQPWKSPLDRKSYFKSGVIVTATNLPNLRAVDAIEIHCDIVEPSLTNQHEHPFKHAETPILYQFFPNVPRKYKISESPQQRLYVPVRKGTTKIQHLTLYITDHRGRLLENRNVNNIVYLDLKIQ